ncbi:MAG: hypothetical protein GXP62_16720, partial [Oligoflexia bacterium]|nr:hypothetical protein [Oligoflexia bacterium]
PDQRHNRLLCDRDDADRTLSRQHLVLQGLRQIVLRGASRLIRDSAPPRSVQGPLMVQAGDLLVLGTATRLRVR